MYVCKTCGQTYSEPVKFCGKCGGDSFDSNGYTSSEYSAYGNPAPTYTYASSPAPAGGSKVPSIVGMACGISAAFLAFYMFIMCASMASSYYFADEAFASFFGFSFFVVPLSIVGLVMSFKGGEVLKGMTIAGKVTSFVAIGLCGISFLVCLGGLL